MILNKKIIDYFFKQSEIGDWEKVNIYEIEKTLKLKKNSLYKVLTDKIYFLTHYDRIIDKRVIKSVTKEDFKLSNPDEIIQEYIMNKLDFMNENKFAISNIINFYIGKPLFFLISLKSSKKSIQLYVNNFFFSENIVKKKILEKIILTLFLLAFKKWLYEDINNHKSFAILDKGIKRIKKSTNLFEALKKDKV
jgi:hypothetical protein